MENIFICDNNTAVVDTTAGKVKGYVYKNIYMFKGIPYAKAKRFHKPEPTDKWDNVFDATNYGFVCPLLDSKAKPMGEVAVPHRYWVMNEDCLNLNIWTLGCDDKKRPVMVWLHGGGFEAGSSIEQIAYEGENMCQYGDVVVVSLNHRLNVLGYCDLSAFGEEYENSGNAGTDDIIAALKWIHDNIEGFGGDPENVTVFGQSGGGAKVTTLLQSPEADGLIAKGINMSGVIGPLLAGPEGSGEALGKALMEELKLESIKELEEVPYEDLAEAYKKVKPQLLMKGCYVGGAPFKNAHYAGDPNIHGFREETKDVPLIVGSVFGEFASFAPYRYDRNSMSREEGIKKCEELFGEEAMKEILPLFEEAYPDRNPVDILTLDFIFRLPEQEYIRKRSKLNNNTYSYIFDVDMPIEGGKTPWHCCDIPYFFRNSALVPVSQIPGVSDRVEDEIFSRVMAFAHTGNPNAKDFVNWEPSTAEEEKVLVINKESELKTNFDEKLIPTFAKYMGPVFQKQMSDAQVQH